MIALIVVATAAVFLLGLVAIDLRLRDQLRRIEEAARFQEWMLGRIAAAARADIAAGDFDWEWRYDEYGAVSLDDLIGQRDRVYWSLWPADPARPREARVLVAARQSAVTGGGPT